MLNFSTVTNMVDKICSNPQGNKQLQGDLSGFRSRDFTFKELSYRIAYIDPSLGSNQFFEIPDEHSVAICYMGTRQNFYDKLRRFIYSTKSNLAKYRRLKW